VILMTRNRQVVPRPILPELIESGDIIEVQYPDADGITTIKRGVVAYVQAHAGMRHFLTQQGAVIARYAPGMRSLEKFTLIARIAKEQPMLDMFTETGIL